MININSFKRNVFSQNGEDGVIEFILGRLPCDKWCCEFGAWDGKYLSNTFNLVKNHDYKAVYIEADPEKFKSLQSTKLEYENIIPLNYTVGFGDDSLDKLLTNTSIPIDFDILSIDVDGIDYALWQSVKIYRPKVVIIEINSSLDPDINYGTEELTVECLNTRTGVNFKSCLELGNSKEYTLLTHIGNMIFIDNKYRAVFGDTDILKDDINKFDRKWL